MLRIVSLIASASDITHALGLTPYQVGRSNECDYPDEIHSLPICTKPSFPISGNSAEIDRLVKERIVNALSVYEVFQDVLDSLQPTHIVTQTQCRVCAVSLEDVERALAGSVTSRPKLVALEPNSLEDIWTDIRRVALACEVAATGEETVFSYQDRMREISAESRRASTKPRVACIAGHEPLMAAGNWVPELIDMAGAGHICLQPPPHFVWGAWCARCAFQPPADMPSHSG